VAKTIAGLAKVKVRGLARVRDCFTLAMAAYNLIRMPKLLGWQPTLTRQHGPMGRPIHIPANANAHSERASTRTGRYFRSLLTMWPWFAPDLVDRHSAR
jgi:hypothetical protein